MLSSGKQPANIACTVLQVDQSSGKGLSATDCPQAQPSRGCFVGMHIVFWTRSHTAKLKQKLVQAGAELEDTISEKTHLVVAARDTSAVDAAANLASVPKAIPRLSKKWEGRKLKIPTNVDFVVPQYISDCLVQSRILPTNVYLIALQQVATKDTRTYSNEEVPANSCEAQEVNQVQPEAQPQQSQGGNMQQQVAKHHQETSVTPVAEHQENSASASAPAPPATQQHSSVSAEPAVGPEATRLGIYPNVNPQGRSFTGGATGIPWGTGGTCTQQLHTSTDMPTSPILCCCVEPNSWKMHYARSHPGPAVKQHLYKTKCICEASWVLQDLYKTL